MVTGAERRPEAPSLTCTSAVDARSATAAKAPWPWASEGFETRRDASGAPARMASSASGAAGSKIPVTLSASGAGRTSRRPDHGKAQRITKSVGTSSGKQSPAFGCWMTYWSAVHTPPVTSSGVQPAERVGSMRAASAVVMLRPHQYGTCPGLFEKRMTPIMS